MNEAAAEGRLFALPEPEPDAWEARLDDFGPTTTLRGALSEMRAIQVLLERGFKVAIPVVDDDGVDMVVNYRRTVQVKSSARMGHAGRFPSWHFGFTASWNYRKDGSRSYRPQSATADFWVCHAVPVDAWWIVPREALLETGFRVKPGSAFSLSTEPTNQRKYGALSARCRDAWELLT